MWDVIIPNPVILESSVCMKPLLWAQDYCSIPKWQTQNTVRVIRVIAKPTTWKTSTVFVPRTQPITIEKLGRKCSIKVQPQWKEYNLNLSSGGKLQFSFYFYFHNLVSLIFFSLTNVSVSVQHVHMHIHLSLWCFLPGLCWDPHFKDMAIHLIYE